MPAPTPLTSYTPGTPLESTAQFSFGGYLFPLTCQLKADGIKLSSDRKHLPFNYGDHIPPNTSVAGRDIELNMDIGSLILGSNGTSQIVSAQDLRNERNQLANLQMAGRQQLWLNDQRYCWAYLNEFNDQPFQDGGLMRYSTWNLKFIADDPRYYSTASHSLAALIDVGGGDYSTHSESISHLGNVRAYPKVLITAKGTTGTTACSAPSIVISNTIGSITIGWSLLQMAPGDMLAIDCDPRPEHRAAACVLTTAGVRKNAFQYINVVTDLHNTLDFSEVFPYIETALIGGSSQLFGVQCAGNTLGYTCEVTWSDTWL